MSQINLNLIRYNDGELFYGFNNVDQNNENLFYVSVKYFSKRQYTSNYFENKLRKPLVEMTEKIKEKDNFSLVRFGDGELFCMMGKEGANCDNHPYTPELGDKLIDSFHFLKNKENIYFGEWDEQPGSFGNPQNVEMQKKDTPEYKFQKELIEGVNLNLVNFEILQNNTLFKEKYNFYKTIKESKRKKIYVGPYNKLKGSVNFLKLDSFVDIPLINSFEKYDKILKLIKDEIEDDCIILFSAGMPCESYIHEVLKCNEKITCLDIGSGFDSLFYGITREGQLDNNTVKNFYKELL